MASYANPKTVTYTRTVAGATAATWSISPPLGCTQFRVAGISASVTTAFVGTTTPAKLGVGVAGNVNAAGFIDFGTAAVPSAVNTAVGFSSQFLRGTNPVYGSLDLTGTSNTISGTPTVPVVVGPALITLTASTGGTPAGAAIAEITLDWF